jgi:hypothetical protein
MKKIIASVLLASTLLPSVAWAEDASKPIDPYADVAGVSPLRKGQKSPFAGVLLTPKATATIIANAETEKEKIDLEVTKAVGEALAKERFKGDEERTKCTADKKTLQASIDEKDARIKIVSDELAKASDPPSRTTWAGVGFVGGVVATILIIYGVGKATK